MLEVTLAKSLIGRKEDHIATAHALGPRKVGKTVKYKGAPQIKDMMNKISYLLKVEKA